jgi:hypothetical protein
MTSDSLQATAYSSVFDYVNAEGAFLRGLRVLFSDEEAQAFDNEFCDSFVLGLLINYIYMAGIKTGNPISYVGVIYITAGLLQASGISLQGRIPPVDYRIQDLKTEYRTQERARLTLSEAFQSDSLEAFYAALMSYSNKPDVCGLVFGEPPKTSQKIKDGPNGPKEITRKHSTTFHSIGAMGMCAFPDCPVKFVPARDLNRCSKCKIAQYCSRACQVAHWKVHKPTCLRSGKA